MDEQKLHITVTLKATTSGKPYYPDTLDEVDGDDKTDGNSKVLLNDCDRLTKRNNRVLSRWCETINSYQENCTWYSESTSTHEARVSYDS